MNPELENGKVIIFSAPSGAGKTTIVHNLLTKELNLSFSVSACTRAKRENEIDGKDYYFLTTEEFKNSISKDLFIEWEQVYKNQFYGTLKKEVDRIWEKNKHVIFDVDVKGGIALKKYFKEKALAIFIQPPSILELEKRLLNRGSESKSSLKKRVEKAEYELSFKESFDVTIVNDHLQQACNNVENEIRIFLNQS